MGAKSTTRGDELSARAHSLRAHGVTVPDERQVYIADEVDLRRIRPGAVLHPGTRIEGPRAFVGVGAEVAREGSTVLRDCVLGAGARIDSGSATSAVLLAGASLGPSAYVREATLLEEQASTAHAVGLKHTILLACVTIGSLVNLCDCLVAGGSSRQDHSEVGSGFIHFNFTPWGRRGDKATPSLMGDVVHGVFMRQARIFMGGAGGAVGPRRVGFGAVVGAGQVLRRDVGDSQLVVDPARSVDRPVDRYYTDSIGSRLDANVDYIAQLESLRAWYFHVRAPQSRGDERVTLLAALDVLELAVIERRTRLMDFLVERGAKPSADMLSPLPLSGATTSLPPDLGAREGGEDHLKWLARLRDESVAAGQSWLATVAARTGQELQRAHVLRPVT